MDIQPCSPVNHNVFYRSATPAGNTVNPQSGCFCCLIENEPLFDLKTCKHALFFQEYYMTNPSSHFYVCLLCHRMLVKIQLFQKQVRESCMVLKKRLAQISRKLINLEVTQIATFTFPDDLETTVKIEIEEESETNENPPFEFVTDIKIEHDSNSEFENDLPLSEVQKTVEKPKKTKKKENLKRKPVQKIAKKIVKPVKGKIVKPVKEKIVIPVKETIVKLVDDKIVKPLKPVIPVKEKLVIPVKEKIVKPVEEKIVQPVEEKIVQPVEEKIVKPVKEKLVIPVKEKMVKPVEEKIVQPVEEKIVQPVKEKNVKPVKEKIMIPVEEKLVQPVEEKIVLPVEEKIVKPVKEKIVKPVKEKNVKPMKGKIVKPVKKKIVKPVKEVKPKILNNMYEGKIIVINISRLELEEERERESQKESYLKLPFKCESCVKGFDHESTLESHNEKQHSQKKNGHLCDVCQTILSYTSFREHTKRHYRRYQCVACGRRSQGIHSLAQHYNLHHEEGAISQKFTCTECDFTTESNRVYRYHRDKHKQKQQCSVCGNSFASANSLRIHMLHVHKQSSREYKCPLCDKTYSSKSGLHSHHAAAHSLTSTYCASCRKYFRTTTGLTHHLRTHSAHIASMKEQLKYVCNDCGVSYLKKISLQEHIDWHHLKIVRFECPKCFKVFKSSSTLRSHKKYVHDKKTKPRDKICHYCGRGFTTTGILRCHIRTHTGERPLVCSHCNATFAHSAALYTHCKLLHKPKPHLNEQKDKHENPT